MIISRRIKNLAGAAKEGEVGERSIIDSCIGGYCLAIDLTARNVQEEAKKKGLPWTIAKGFDTFCPVSEVVPKERVRDPQDVVLWLRVNGVERQRGSTASMLFPIPRLLKDISAVMTLDEGDLILTGTPKGVGSLVAGDRVQCGMEVGGEEVLEGRIEVVVEDAPADVGGYEFRET